MDNPLDITYHHYHHTVDIGEKFSTIALCIILGFFIQKTMRSYMFLYQKMKKLDAKN